MDGRAVAVVEGGEVFFVRTDHIGRPVFSTDPDGLKVWEASYLPFGGVHVSTGAITLRFPGQWFQSESGLHQNWMRDYDPTTGRYLQADPLGLVDGASVYGYALGNPGRWVDPRGEEVLTGPRGRGPGGIAGSAAPGTPLGDALADSLSATCLISCTAYASLALRSLHVLRIPACAFWRLSQVACPRTGCL